MRIQRYLWEEILMTLNVLSKNILHNNPFQKFDSIYGIPRGGLVPAVILSHKFNAPLILDPKLITKDTLVVDDISDSGQTFLEISKESCTTLSLFKRHSSKFCPNYFGIVVYDDRWIQFPWETDKTTRDRE